MASSWVKMGGEKRRVTRPSSSLLLLVVVVALGGVAIGVANGQPLVPAVIIFGDSVVDSGNNNRLPTLIKANFPPYGRDFPGHSPTGRFCNGKLATDFAVETLGFDAYPPAYLGPNAAGDNLLIGANFASAASGYLDATAILYEAMPLTRQLSYYKEYQAKLAKIAGDKAKAAAIISGGIHLLSAGTSDFLQNYYINPFLNQLYTPAQFADLLLKSFTSFIQRIYELGARRIGVTSLPPMGCLPASITIYGLWRGDCVGRLNNDSLVFNQKLKAASDSLRKRLPGLKLVVFDVYGPLLDLINDPASSGFFEARKACCGTGTIETSILCNARSPGTCRDAAGYVFWDSFHTSEAANKVLADALIVQGIDLIS